MTPPGHSVRVPEATYARVPMGEAFDVLTSELDEILDRALADPPLVRVQANDWNPSWPWLVMCGRRVVCPFSRPGAAVRFAREYARQEGYRVDEESLSVERGTEGSAGTDGESGAVPRAGDAHTEPASPLPNVVPIRRDVA